MKKCPHCNASLSFFRVMFNRWTVYRCPRCGHKARIPAWEMNLVDCIGIGLAALSGWFFIPRFGGWLLPVLVFIVAALVTFSMMLFCHFQPEKKDEKPSA
jgi:hypothetical protein